MFKYTIIIFLLFPFNLFSQNKVDTLNNDKVIKMVKSGLTPFIIVKSINSAKFTNFDLSSDGLIALKKNGVPDSLVSLMFDKSNNQFSSNTIQGNGANNSKQVHDVKSATIINKPSSSESLDNLEPGIYLENEGSDNYIRLNGIIGQYRTKTDFVIGLTAKASYQIPGKSALVKTKIPSPVFYMIIGDGPGDQVFEPSRILMARSEVKKDNRYIIAYKGLVGMSQYNSTTLSKGEGIIIPTFTRISNKLYKITFEKKLPPGNYFFCPSSVSYATPTFWEFDVVK